MCVRGESIYGSVLWLLDPGEEKERGAHVGMTRLHVFFASFSFTETETAFYEHAGHFRSVDPGGSG